ncbi:glutamine synthetase (plasmid) [Natrialba magadii ATCC 43099]|uniref:Glutamate--ammonia ligase n=1 Tax=Natrialba magadii (strain ATCC 43099 / DSM 3394 / CCM 3739 / CIP 104546 / IAM 13178 / JCM 8861 / NBRC 102185 / NCIMB 2190 / MS3) TaxID=547559 RepID=D3T231_NATMM|nr:glutamine synthetase family protein [Natrialba magadii]ADD07640.1 glutamine synthetase [Natrialba magadii ATCC 43099]ELY27120.1 glutamate--ammonia ligase [Natrialba magadii ATCC 43099]
MIPDTITQTIEAEGIGEVIVEFPDIDGVARSKRVDADYFIEKFETGFSMNMLLLGVSSMTDVPEGSGLGESLNFADGTIHPVPETFRVVPWRDDTACVRCTYSFRGDTAGAYTRDLLARVVDNGPDLDIGVGAELEFHLLRENEDKSKDEIEPLTDGNHECITRATEAATAVYDHLRSWSDAMDIPLQVLMHEFGAGQFEVLFEHAGPMRTADRAFTFRELVKRAADAEDLTGTFMAVPFTDASANGFHLHVSAFDGEDNAFADGDTLSATGRAFVGGLLEHADALVALGCPTINSFKRFTPGSFSPYTRSWGYNNRTAAVRIPESKPLRVENRIPGADANPYLVVAATLAAGFHGVRENIDPGEPVDGDAAGQRPPLEDSPEVALRALENDDVLTEALGEEFIQAYTAVKRREREKFNDHVTDWERRYLGVL